MRTEDGNIIHECLNGKPQAFGMLVDKYKEGVYAFVYAELGDFQDAQDVTQEVFLQAYRDLRNLRRWESFVFWLYRIARRRCIQWFRARSRRIDGEFIEDQNPTVIDAGSLDSYRDSQLGQSLREAMDSLPETHREVLLLHYFAGMNSREIAGAIGISPGAVRMRLTRARAQLREEMVAMIDTAFEGQRIPAGFTLRIVEAVKHIKVHPMPRMTGLPWGLSLAAGIIVTVLSLNPQMNITSDMAVSTGSPLPVEAKVLKAGEIPVDILETSEISVIASKQGDGDGVATPNVFMLAPQQGGGGKWTQKANMPTARLHFSACAIDGKIYAIAGVTPQAQFYSTLEMYDPKTDKWAKKADIPTPTNLQNCASVVNGKIYAIGGNDAAGNWLSTVAEYNPKTDRWTRKSDMPTPRTHLSTCALNGKIYAIGGIVTHDLNDPASTTVEEYDPATDTWTRKADMLTPRTSLDTAALNGRIYAIGGTFSWKNGPDLSVVEEYDPVTDTWTRKADMLFPRFGVSAVALDGRLYAIGGVFVPGIVYPPPEVYDPVTDTWTELPEMQSQRRCASSVVVNGKIYVLGGAENNAALSAVEEYTPEDWKSVSPRGRLSTKWGEVKSE